MTMHLGNVDAGSTLYIPFMTFNSAAASVTLTGLAVTDIEIYKNGSTTQRASDAGYALLDTDGIDFDGITGIHGFSVDLSDNTDASFYAAGNFYWVVVSAVTVDAQTVNFIAATFRIGPVAANVTQLAGVTQSLTDLKDFADDGYDPSTNKVQGVVLTDTATTLTNLPAITAGWLTATGIAADAITAAKLAADVATELQSGLATAANLAIVAGYLDTEIATLLSQLALVKAVTDQFVFTVANQVDANALTGGGGGGATAEDVRVEMDSNSTKLAQIATDTTTDIPALIAALNNLSSAQAQTAAAAALAAYDPATHTETLALLTTAMTESYAANGVAPTLTQAIMAIHQFMMQHGPIAGTSWPVKKLDNTTTAFTVTIDDAVEPTGLARV